MKRFCALTACLLLVAAPAGAQPPGSGQGLIAGETNVTAQGPGGVLAGTLDAPPGDVKGAPVAIIIPGSGATDRNGDAPPGAGLTAQPYLLLAHALAPLGVATLRIDKRGMYGSADAGDANKILMSDNVADLHAWAASAKALTGAPCVWLIGHSDGGLQALAAARANPKDLCGLVLIASPGRPFADILREQLRANPANAPILAEALADIDALAAGQHIDQSHMTPVLLPLFRAAVQDYLIDEFKYDPAKLAAAYPGPILVLQGTNDIQVSPVDAQRLAGARPGIKLVELPGVNHVLKVAPLDRAANVATYNDPSLPLAPGIADAIASFMRAPPAGS
ncbi:MAG TPA: alpha/beta hydrolase [Caulobacteraceae bacterium]|jgi:hypothetical protein|nr:alpha/beta hydrolase [Caulobacteraceae bacterium]